MSEPPNSKREKALVFSLYADTVVRTFLGFITGLVLLVGVVALCINPSWPLAALDGLLTVVLAYYFPKSQPRADT